MKVNCPFCGKFMSAWFISNPSRATRTCVCGFEIILPPDCGYYPAMKIKLIRSLTNKEDLG